MYRYRTGNSNHQSAPGSDGQHPGSSMQRTIGNTDSQRSADLHLVTLHESEFIDRFIGDR